MVETCHLKNIVTFYKFCAVQKNYCYIDFSQLAPVYVPEDLENAYAKVLNQLHH